MVGFGLGDVAWSENPGVVFYRQETNLFFRAKNNLCETTIFICKHVVPRPASRLETCFPSCAWNLMTHNKCFQRKTPRD